MNINPEFSEEELNAEIATEQSMYYLWDNFIEPNIDKEDIEQMTMVSVIGMTLKAIGAKARAYEKLENGEFEENSFFRN